MSTTTVTATYLDPTGAPCKGRVVFRLVAATYQDGLDAIFPTVPVTGVLDAAGEFTVELEPTSGVDAALDADDMTYQVTEKIHGADRSVYYVDIPTSAAVDLGTLATYDDPPMLVRQFVTPDLSALGYAEDDDLTFVRLEHYNVTGDGVTDDTANFQTALTAAAAAGLPLHGSRGATYRLTQLTPTSEWSVTVPTGTRLVGNRATIFQDGVNGALGSPNYPGHLGIYNALQGLAGSHDVDISGWEFLGENDPFTYVGNQSAAIDVAISAACTDWKVHDNTFRNLHGFPVHHQASGSRIDVYDNTIIECGNDINVNADHSRIEGNHTIDSGGAIEAGGAHVHIIDNHVKDSVGSPTAISVGGNQTVAQPGLVCTGNTVDGSEGCGIVVSDGTDGAKVNGNTISRTMSSAIQAVAPTIESHRAQIHDNTIIATGDESGVASDRQGIYVSGFTDMSIQGNTIIDRGDAGYSLYYGIQALDCDNLDIAGNTISGEAGKALYIDSCADAVIGENNLDPASVQMVNGSTSRNGSVFGDVGGFGFITIKGVDYTATGADRVIFMDGTNKTLTLPDPSLAENLNRVFVVKNRNVTALTVVSAGSSKKIDTAASVSLAQHAHATYMAVDFYQWVSI